MKMAKAIPYLAVVTLQLFYAGMDVLLKLALDDGMSTYVFITYRHLIAFVAIAPFAAYYERGQRPRMTFAVFMKIFVLSLLEAVIDQNFYFLGMKYTSATFAAAMSNMIPALTFVLACILRLESIKIRERRSQAKMAGTVIVVAGAMIMTLLKGPVVLPAFGSSHSPSSSVHGDAEHHMLTGSIFIILACFSCACFATLQAITLKTYDAPLSLATLICLLGTVDGAVVAFLMETRSPSTWSIQWDMRLLFAIYTGVLCSAIGYYLSGVVMKIKGLVFLTTFSPLCMIMVAIMSYFFLHERMLLGRVLGALVICLGLFVVLWGKSNDDKDGGEGLEK